VTRYSIWTASGTVTPPLSLSNNLDDRPYSGHFDLKISSQNCNSLNLSCPDQIRNDKIGAIFNLNSDIIFLSDIRANGNSSTFLDLIKLRYRGYINSTMAKRGVAILIRHDLNYNVITQINDPNENFIILNLTINDSHFILASVYGPNNDDESFFDNLSLHLGSQDCRNIVVGGDWNTTPSMLNATHNPDTYRMCNLPSARRSEWLSALCEKTDLIDIFRVINGDYSDFTYIPFGLNRKNRSRIDFFLVSAELINVCRKCETNPLYSKKLFDHKPVVLVLGKKLRNKNATVSISNRTINNPLFFYNNATLSVRVGN
jgi:exonuclease III